MNKLAVSTGLLNFSTPCLPPKCVTIKANQMIEIDPHCPVSPPKPMKQTPPETLHSLLNERYRSGDLNAYEFPAFFEL